MTHVTHNLSRDLIFRIVFQAMYRLCRYSIISLNCNFYIFALSNQSSYKCLDQHTLSFSISQKDLPVLDYPATARNSETADNSYYPPIISRFFCIISTSTRNQRPLAYSRCFVLTQSSTLWLELITFLYLNFFFLNYCHRYLATFVPPCSNHFTHHNYTSRD